MPAVSILPYQPAPFEDEILGSWFARLKLHNTQYLWNSFVTTCSGKNPSFAYNFSVFDYLPSDRAQSSRLVLKKLFEALRISEMDVENRHSTLPYWRSTPGPTHAPFALHRWVGTPTQLHPLFEKLPKFCIDCLASDTQREGEPYWHRAHQLPGVKVCHAHQSLLHTSCPSCEQIAGIHADRLIPALSSYCSCGSVLSHIEPQYVTSDNEDLRYAKLSSDALSGRLPPWNRQQLVSFLDNKVGLTMKRVEILRNSWKMADLSKKQCSRLISPDAIKLLVTCGMDAESLRSDFSAKPFLFHKISTSAQQRELRPKSELTIKQAKDTLLGLKDSFRSRGSSILRSRADAYCLLQLNEPQWLAHEFSLGRIPRAPSIEDDRASMLRLLDRAFQDKTYILDQRPLHTFARGRIRDSEWVKTHVDEAVRNLRQQRRTAKKSSQASKFVGLIEAAIQTSFSNNDLPSKFTYTFLAKQTGITVDQIANLVQHDLALAARLRSSNQALTEKRIHDVIEKLHNLGQKITVTKILKATSLAHQAASPLIKRLLEETHSGVTRYSD